MSLKSSALEAIRHERAQWHALVDSVGDRINERGVTPEWSFKDLAGHLLGWRQRAVEQVQAEARNEPPPPPPWPSDLTTDDEINRWIDEHQRQRSTEEILVDMDNTYERLARLVESLPEEALTDTDRYKSLSGEPLGNALGGRSFFSHLHEEHMPDIRRWLQDGA